MGRNFYVGPTLILKSYPTILQFKTKYEQAQQYQTELEWTQLIY